VRERQRGGVENRRTSISNLQVRGGGNLLVKAPDATESAKDPGGNVTFLACSTLFVGCRGVSVLVIMIMIMSTIIKGPIRGNDVSIGTKYARPIEWLRIQVTVLS